MQMTLLELGRINDDANDSTRVGSDRKGKNDSTRVEPGRNDSTRVEPGRNDSTRVDLTRLKCESHSMRITRHRKNSHSSGL